MLGEERKLYPITGLCRVFGVSRQSYYQHKGIDFHKEAFKGLVIRYVRRVREDFPRIGYLMLFEKCKLFFGPSFSMGRDAFYKLLHEYKLMLKWKTRSVRTTNSNHLYRRYTNLLKDVCPIAPCAVWVSDITFIRLQESFCYLSLITDAYSRKIVGWRVGRTLEAEYTIDALRMALEDNRKNGFELEGLIHHSDRGVQYACYEYTGVLEQYNCRISMTQNGDPLENAMAERVNGILKQEWLYQYTFNTIEDVNSRMSSIIHLYNTQRPHSSIGNRTPEMVHHQVPYVPEEYNLEEMA